MAGIGKALPVLFGWLLFGNGRSCLAFQETPDERQLGGADDCLAEEADRAAMSVDVFQSRPNFPIHLLPISRFPRSQWGPQSLAVVQPQDRRLPCGT